LKAFILHPKNTTLIDIYPTEVQTPEAIPEVDDFTRWTLIFSHSHFSYGATYEFGIEPNMVYNSIGIPFMIPNPHRYTMITFDTNCGGYGKYNSSTNKCDCDPLTHRTGPQCNLCEPDYEFNGDYTKCIPKETCKADTCGCLPDSPPGLCNPIGTCTEDKQNILNPIQCTCNDPRYTGPRCNYCATGFDSQPYPNCMAVCNPPCVHGTCSNYTGTCKCSGNFAGVTCSDCAPGFSGSNCDTQSKLTGIIVSGILAVIFTSAIIAVLVWRCSLKPKTEFYDHGMELELDTGKRVGNQMDDQDDMGLIEENSEDEDEKFLSD